MPKLTIHPLSNAKVKYARHKSLAKFRNINFHFTFNEWYNWWLSNGIDKNTQNFSRHDSSRPCMGRNDDLGPYAPNNVYVVTQKQNAKDRPRYRRKLYKSLKDHFCNSCKKILTDKVRGLDNE